MQLKVGTVDSRQKYRDSVNTQLPYRPAIVILKFLMMSSICQQYSTLHFMDVTSIFPICRRRRLLGNVFRYISHISRQGYLVRRRLKLELPSAMSGPCQHFTSLRNLTQTFSDGISSTPSESTDWWMSLPYLQRIEICEISECVGMNLCDVVILKPSSQAGKENKNDFR